VLRTWERGAGLTKACGTAACAAAVAAARLRRTDRKVTITLPGGDLQIEWRERDGHVLMTGRWNTNTRAVSMPPCLWRRERHESLPARVICVSRMRCSA